MAVVVAYVVETESGGEKTPVGVNCVVETELPGARKKTLVAVRACLSRGRQIHETPAHTSFQPR